MAYRSLPKFNPETRFEANRIFAFNGREFQPGEPVQDIPQRRLRQLFELRKVRPVEERKPAVADRAARKGKK